MHPSLQPESILLNKYGELYESLTDFDIYVPSQRI